MNSNRKKEGYRKEKWQENVLRITAFMLPVIILWCGYALQKIVPFGDNLVYTWDLSGQYSSFYLWLHRALLGQVSWNYTLTGAFGSNTAGLIAYYLSSPFNLILLFFSEKTMPYGVSILISLKIGLMGLFMNLYLRHKEDHKIAVVFSTMYALSSYVVAYQSNIMWLDAVVLLPFVVWGIEKIIEQQKFIFYVIVLAIAVCSNYFTGYMICLFSAIYFVFYVVLFGKGRRVKACLQFMIGSIVSIGITGVILLPAALSLGTSANRSHAHLNALLNWSKLYYYRQMLPIFMAATFSDVQRQEVSYSSPLLYCGILVVFGTVLFFVSRKVQMRQKIFFLMLLAILAFSFAHMNLFILWHGMYSPLGAPWRNAFVWSFVAVSVAYIGIARNIPLTSKMEGNMQENPAKELEYCVDKRAMVITLVSMILFFIVVYWKFYAYRGAVKENVFFATLEIVGMIGLMYFGRFKKLSKGATLHYVSHKMCYSIGLCLAVVIWIGAMGAEEVYNMQQIWNESYEWDSDSDYQAYLEDLNTLINADSENETASYREETIGQAERSTDDGFLLGINTIDMYTSTETANNWGILYTLGLGLNIPNSGYYDGSTQLIDDLVGLKYIYAESDSTSLHQNYAKTDEVDDLAKYENEDALPLAYLVNASAISISMADRETQDADLFAIQNALYQALPGNDASDVLYRKLKDEDATVILDEAQITPEEGKITWLFGDYYTDGNAVYEEDQEALTETMALCQEKTLSVDATEASHLKATIQNDTGENSYVCFTIPYESGWQVTVNGVKTSCTEGMGGFLLVPVSEGEQEIVLTYHVPGQRIGLFISLFSCMVVILLWRKGRKKNV